MLLSTRVEICSRHFHEHDILLTPNRLKKLKKTALPIMIESSVITTKREETLELSPFKCVASSSRNIGFDKKIISSELDENTTIQSSQDNESPMLQLSPVLIRKTFVDLNSSPTESVSHSITSSATVSVVDTEETLTASEIESNTENSIQYENQNPELSPVLRFHKNRKKDFVDADLSPTQSVSSTVRSPVTTFFVDVEETLSVSDLEYNAENSEQYESQNRELTPVFRFHKKRKKGFEHPDLLPTQCVSSTVTSSVTATVDMEETLPVSDLESNAENPEQYESQNRELTPVFRFHKKRKKGFVHPDLSPSQSVSSTVTSPVTAFFVDMEDTLSASDVEENIKKPSLPQHQTGVKKRKHYIGDFKIEDCDSPEQIKKYFRISRNTVVRQRKKIKTLQTSVQRLKSKVQSLKELLKVLQRKLNMTETALNAIEQ